MIGEFAYLTKARELRILKQRSPNLLINFYQNFA